MDDRIQALPVNLGTCEVEGQILVYWRIFTEGCQILIHELPRFHHNMSQGGCAKREEQDSTVYDGVSYNVRVRSDVKVSIGKAQMQSQENSIVRLSNRSHVDSMSVRSFIHQTMPMM
jgi:hypothetical protein